MPLRSHRAPNTSGAITKPEWLLEGYIRERTITMITASPNTGKTMLGLRMAMSCVSRLPFFGVRVQHPVPVLYCAWDAPDWDYAGIFQKLVRGLTQEERPTAARIRRHLSPYHDLVFLWERLGVDKSSIGDFIRGIRPCFKDDGWPDGYDPGLIIFDTFAESHNCGNENDNMEMRKVMQAFKDLSHTRGIPTVILHHPPHTPPGEPLRARGASIVEGSADTQLTLRELKDDPSHLILEWRKIRGENRPAQVHYHRITGENDRGEFMRLEHEPDFVEPTKENILPILSQLLQKPSRAMSLRDKLGISKSALHRYLKELGAVTDRGYWQLPCPTPIVSDKDRGPVTP